jgi:hypothetical protein
MLLRLFTPRININTRALLLRKSIYINNKLIVHQLIKSKLMSTKSESEWRVILTPEQFRVLRQKGKIT